MVFGTIDSNSCFSCKQSVIEKLSRINVYWLAVIPVFFPRAFGGETKRQMQFVYSVIPLPHLLSFLSIFNFTFE